jgi:hypothetical protein
MLGKKISLGIYESYLSYFKVVSIKIFKLQWVHNEIFFMYCTPFKAFQEMGSFQMATRSKLYLNTSIKGTYLHTYQRLGGAVLTA